MSMLLLLIDPIMYFQASPTVLLILSAISFLSSRINLLGVQSIQHSHLYQKLMLSIIAR